jgi:peptidoglycan/xylan/chitin deacetylase (PgdA/CDA1 family)
MTAVAAAAKYDLNSSKDPTEHKILVETRSSASYTSSGIPDSNVGGDNSNNNNAEAAIINFDDGSIDQYKYAKPILDKYGLKATL